MDRDCHLLYHRMADPAFTKYSGLGEGSAEALAILRDGAQFKWYVIPLLLVVLNSTLMKLAGRTGRSFGRSGILSDGRVQ